MRYNKYGNKKTLVDGILFDSKKEAERYKELKLLKKQGVVLDFSMQVPYSLLPAVKGKFPGRIYKADFVVTYSDGSVRIEDVKGVKTDIYKLKKHLLYALYGLEIYEL